MASVPSRRRSQRLSEICNAHNLMDPYRHFNPDRREYTFTPNAVANNNRSRLDFFLSKGLAIRCKKCTIGHHLDSLLFDHKSVRLTFGNKTLANKQIINDSILDDYDLANLVKCYVFDHYVNHALECGEFPAELQDNLRQQLGQVLGKIGTYD